MEEEQSEAHSHDSSCSNASGARVLSFQVTTFEVVKLVICEVLERVHQDERDYCENEIEDNVTKSGKAPVMHPVDLWQTTYYFATTVA